MLNYQGWIFGWWPPSVQTAEHLGKPREKQAWIPVVWPMMDKDIPVRSSSPHLVNSTWLGWFERFSLIAHTQGLGLGFSQLQGWIKELHGSRWAGERFWYQRRCRHSKRNFWMVHLLGISVPGFSVWCDTTVPRCCSEESWAAPAHIESSICTRHKTTKHLYLDLL